jgi:hypothetical protein
MLTGATPDVCLRYSQRFEISIRSTRLRPRDASTALPPPVISCSDPPSAGQKAHSIPIDHGPAPSKSAYRKCSGEQHSATPKDFCAGAFPIKPKDLWGVIFQKGLGESSGGGARRGKAEHGNGGWKSSRRHF